ncbi:MAG TPA: hypothetical protein VK636_18940 [Gemmatimonadaceae bacterium]|nr:hypothetical protein [Gemmatimonadaceae bacterium]
MQRSLLALLGSTLFAGLGPAHVTKPPSVQGVWQAVQVTVTGPSPRTVMIPEPRANLTTLTATHYSRVEVHAEGPRSTSFDAASATATELRAVWGPFVGEAGRYEVSGNVITMRPLAAKNPSTMARGAFTTHTFRLQGDTLWVTDQGNQNGPIANPVTAKLVRVE